MGLIDILGQSLGLCVFTGHHLSNLPNARVHASRHDHALSRWMVRKQPYVDECIDMVMMLFVQAATYATLKK